MINQSMTSGLHQSLFTVNPAGAHASWSSRATAST